MKKVISVILISILLISSIITGYATDETKKARGFFTILHHNDDFYLDIDKNVMYYRPENEKEFKVWQAPENYFTSTEIQYKTVDGVEYEINHKEKTVKKDGVLDENCSKQLVEAWEFLDRKFKHYNFPYYKVVMLENGEGLGFEYQIADFHGDNSGWINPDTDKLDGINSTGSMFIYERGDINLSEDIDMHDVVDLQKYIALLGDDTYKFVMDINLDNEENLEDVVSIQRIIAKLI